MSKEKPPQSSLVHELAHAMQECEARGPVDEGMDLAHADWERLGINAALRSLGEP